MLSLVAAALLTTIPQEQKLSEADDFNDVVALNEKSSHCEAVATFKDSEETRIRIVLFRCATGDRLVPMLRATAGDWYPAGVLEESRGKVKGNEI